jgi:Fibronectin type III domain
MKLRHTFGIVAGSGLAAVALAAPTASAFFTATATATGAVHVGVLNPPTAVSAAQVPGTGTVHVQWTAPAQPGGQPIDGYYVERLSGATAAPACGSSPATLLASAGPECDDAAVPAGSFTYRVTAVFRTFTAPSAPSGPVTVQLDASPPAL